MHTLLRTDATYGRSRPSASRPASKGLIAAAFLLALVRSAAAGEAKETSQIDVVDAEKGWVIPKELTLRARVTAMTPAVPVAINWRYGGEGMGGGVTHGSLGLHETPVAPDEKIAGDEKGAKERQQGLTVGAWSPAFAVASLAKSFPGKLFLTFMVEPWSPPRARAPKVEPVKNVEVEFEFSYQGKVLKTFKEAGPDGGTVGMVIPAYRLAGERKPDDPEFLRELCGLSEYAAGRAERMEALPGVKGKAAGLKSFVVVTDCAGYGAGVGYGIRHTNRAVFEAECRTLRVLGVNAFANAPRFLVEMLAARTGFAADFNRAVYAQLGGYPVPGVRKGQEVPEAGCPFAPGVPARAKQEAEDGLAAALKMPVAEVWWRTEDEIGSIFDRALEGKEHLALCPRCAEGFREYVKKLGYAPADFGLTEWGQVKPVNLWPKPPEGKGDAKKQEKPADPPWLADRNVALLAYLTAKFNNYASAQTFATLRETLARSNARKRQALAAGKAESPVAKQPWVYSFALRGNTFLMGGHSLEFFEFYRHADNAFVYETSNRDARVWEWDSYLCDVGRVVCADQGLVLGIYVKPHRGAPIQRALSAVARGARMLYWYTYGPDYTKGDSFSQKEEALKLTAKAARLIAGAEEALYGAAWAQPAEVAIVRPREAFTATPGEVQDALWEEGKWAYTALAHAHVAVDPLDESLLETKDLSRYKAIYVIGGTLTKAAAAKVAKWAEAGGTLYTGAGGLRFDESGRPLEALAPILGLRSRRDPEMWRRVARYGARSLDAWDDPKHALAPVPPGAAVTGEGPLQASLKPVVGREVLDPAPGTEVIARFADGGAAGTRRACGKGQAFAVGCFAGLVYSAPIRTGRFDMAKDFDAGARKFVAAPALALVKPVVDASEPAVEGVLLKNPGSGRMAVLLMNWAYRVSALKKNPDGGLSPIIGHVPFEKVRIAIRGAGEVRKAVSVALGGELPVAKSGDGVEVTVPRLEEGDVLLLE